MMHSTDNDIKEIVEQSTTGTPIICLIILGKTLSYEALCSSAMYSVRISPTTFCCVYVYFASSDIVCQILVSNTSLLCLPGFE